jgi:hypothetical protein
MSLQEYDVVRLRRPLADGSVPVPVGTMGAVVMVYEGGRAYEVEFCDEKGATLALLTLEEGDLEKVPPDSGARHVKRK